MIVRPYTITDIDAVIGLFRSNLLKYFVEAEEKQLRDFLAQHSHDYFVIQIIPRSLSNT